MIWILLFPLLGSILLLIKFRHAYLRRRRKIAAFGCEPVAKIPMQDCLGFRMLQNHLKARKAYRWPSFLIETLETAGASVHTASHRILNQEMLYTRDVENVKAILTDPQDDYVLGYSRGPNIEPLMGNGLFTAEGQTWRHYRICARSLLTRANQESNLETLEKILRSTWTSIPEQHNGWTVNLDLQTTFLDLMLDATIKLLFKTSRSSTSLTNQDWDHEQTEKSTLRISLDAVATYVGNRTILGKLYWVKQSREFRLHCKNIRDYVDSHTLMTFQNLRQSHFKDEEKHLLLNDVEKTKMVTELRNQTQPFLSTGRNGTGALIAVTFFYLMNQPDIYSRLRKEVISAFGNDGKVMYSHLDTCEYLNFCILESLRLSSVVPAIIRNANKDVVLPRGGGKHMRSPIFVAKGTSIIICIHALHRRIDLWGDDAETFNPDRWSSNRFDWSFLPFSKGRRRCIGRENGTSSFQLVQMLTS
ncbi:MAG: hypothetical protein Q9160_006036 [Pyrenula sp. 1 TL-2023]